MDLKKYATESKYRTLESLKSGKAKTQTQIAEETEVSQANISRVMIHLAEAECVENKGMREGYKITEKGEKLHKHLKQIRKQ
jgi:predicted transcriptional regulator